MTKVYKDKNGNEVNVGDTVLLDGNVYEVIINSHNQDVVIDSELGQTSLESVQSQCEVIRGIKVIEWNDDYKCKCGNQSHYEGFHPCDREGNHVEPIPTWEGHYKCDRCNQIIIDKSDIK